MVVPGVYALVADLLLSLPFSLLVSHHPPISAFFYISPMNKLCIVGELRPKSKFLGNSVSTVMEGENRVYLLGRPEDGREYTPMIDFQYSFSVLLPAYVISMPNMYARGILFGKMVIELGDTCTAKCEKLNMTADIEFRTKVCHLLALFLSSSHVWRIYRI